MERQADYKVRMVHLSNLRAMCAYLSSVCHRYGVDPPTKGARFVRVHYSNPDEYGTPRPVLWRDPATNQWREKAVDK